MVLIGIHSDLKDKILNLKLCDRESYGDVVQRLLDSHLELVRIKNEGLIVDFKNPLVPNSDLGIQEPAIPESDDRDVKVSKDSNLEKTEPDNVVDATTPEEKETTADSLSKSADAPAESSS